MGMTMLGTGKKVYIISTLAFICLLVLLLILMLGFFYSFYYIHDQFGRRCNDIFYHSVYREMDAVKNGGALSIFHIDSVFQEDLRKADINAAFVLTRINRQTGEVLEVSDTAFLPVWGLNRTKVLPISTEGAEGVVATIISPFRELMPSFLWMFVFILLMIVFVCWGISNHIKTIHRQNQVAELQQSFFYAMVHDMKSPLNAIMLGVDMLQTGCFDNHLEERKRFFDILKSESEHMLSLINRILSMAKIEEGNLPLFRTRIPLKPFIDELVAKFSVRTSKDITFETCYRKADSVYADKDHLKEMLGNLIDNAVKYSGDSVQIDILCYKEQEKIKIKVKDNGFGIPLKEQTKIFEKFERASITQKRMLKGGATGFGIGLNYVQQIMRAHGGRVELESIEGAGSAFTLVFPMEVGVETERL